MVVALAPIHKLSPIQSVHVATYQSASELDRAVLKNYWCRMKQYANEEELTINKFAYQLLFNLIPQVDAFTENGYTKEEMKMINETRKIMDGLFSR